MLVKSETCGKTGFVLICFSYPRIPQLEHWYWLTTGHNFSICQTKYS